MQTYKDNLKKPRKPWGWGPEGDQPNPFVKAAKDVMQDARETVSDIKDEPAEVPYRLRERAKRYFPWLRRGR